MSFSNMPFAGKVAAGFGAVLAVIVLSASVAVVQTRQAAEIERVNSTSDIVVDEIDKAWGFMAKAQASTRKFILAGYAEDKARAETARAAVYDHLARARTILEADAPEIVASLDEYRAKLDTDLDVTVTAPLRLASDPATHDQAVASVGAPAVAAVRLAADAAFAALTGKVEPWADGFTTRGYAVMNQIQWVVVGAGLISTVLGVLMAWLITRTVARPVQAMTDAMRALAGGDTAVAVPGLGRRDEIGQMAAAVQVFKEASLAKLRLEAEADASRKSADTLRAEAEAARAEVTRQQAQVVEALGSGLAHMAEGDLTHRLATSLAPDYERLRSDFNATVVSLEQALRVVAANAGAIRSGTMEISAAADDLSRRTEQQAASLEETAAALDEITATVRKTAGGAAEARRMVSAAKADAEHSGDVVSRAVAAMTGIEQSSRQIGQIIGVIDEIAFQTNLLALNAGVEAARAGDAGRGFAVVASEVRALAQRSAEAAKEIKALVSSSDRQVKDGVGLVGQTGAALGRILSQVAAINTVVADIAASADEQSTGLDQVNTAINQMDQVTQQNAAMVEQSTAASRALAQEGEALAGVVGRFRVGAATASTAPRQDAPRPPVRRALARHRTETALAHASEPEAENEWAEF